MKKSDALKKAGSVLALAKLLGITRHSIYQWGEEIPAQRVWQLKALKPEWFEI